MWDFEWSLSTQLDFELDFALQIARQAQEIKLVLELEEKYETFFTGADNNTRLNALGEKQEFCVEVVLTRKRKLLDFKASLAKDLWVKVEKLELLESFEDCRELKELTAKLLNLRN